MTPRPRRVRLRRALVTAALAVVGIVCMLLVGALVDPRHVVAGDAHYIFAAARSLAYDGDLDLTNQYLVMGDRWGLGRDPCDDGWRLPPREIGASLLMVPGLWLHHVTGLAPRWEPSFACLLAAASLGACWLGCVRIGDAIGLRDPEVTAGAAVFGFVVPFYAVSSAGYAHAPDAAICAWLCWALLARRGPATIGVLLACAVLTRLQNLVWLAWPLVELIATRSVTTRTVGRAALIAALALLGLAPQLWLGLAHPGSARAAWGWTLSFFDAHEIGRDLLRVLFGVHGLLRWTPIAALALLGLILASQGPIRRADDERESRVALAPLAVFAGMWLLFALVRDVDGGDAFGARRMAGLVGVIALGLGLLWSRVREGGERVRQLAWPLALVMALAVVANLARTQRAIVGELSLVSPDRAPGHR